MASVVSVDGCEHNGQGFKSAAHRPVADLVGVLVRATVQEENPACRAITCYRRSHVMPTRGHESSVV